MRPQAAPSELMIDVAAMRRRHESHASVMTTLPPAFVANALSGTDATIADGVAAVLSITVQGDGSVIVTGTLQGGYTVGCARCLEPAAVDAASQVTALYVIEGTARRLPDVRADDDEDGPGDEADGDEDLWPFDGMTLDLRPMLTETLKLTYPMRALCTRGEACRGLCSHCGAALNEQPPQPLCTACGAVDPAVPLVDEIPDGSVNRGALADALRHLDPDRKPKS
ncbi:MAG: DUF177 domain-containing protein [Deltaproteobacteria bacterium]|nr:DUF177 domain-containing protein [Deltaproteobacteria bacterium]MBK8720097.1 DUF177 domain-containing protein [Deltaproteobacteria bacterium]